MNQATFLPRSEIARLTATLDAYVAAVEAGERALCDHDASLEEYEAAEEAARRLEMSLASDLLIRAGELLAMAAFAAEQAGEPA